MPFWSEKTDFGHFESDIQQFTYISLFGPQFKYHYAWIRWQNCHDIGGNEYLAMIFNCGLFVRWFCFGIEFLLGRHTRESVFVVENVFRNCRFKWKTYIRWNWSFPHHNTYNFYQIPGTSELRKRWGSRSDCIAFGFFILFDIYEGYWYCVRSINTNIEVAEVSSLLYRQIIYAHPQTSCNEQLSVAGVGAHDIIWRMHLIALSFDS